jgi:hypothetical protein
MALRPHMDRAAPAAPVAIGAGAYGKGAAGAARSIAFCNMGRRLRIQASNMLAVHLVLRTKWNAGLQPACCNMGRCLWKKREPVQLG